MANDDEDDIPVLQDILRPGERAPAGQRDGAASGGERQDDSGLTDAEIEAIAARVIERHTERMQHAVAQAIRQAIRLKARMRRASESSGTKGDRD